MQWYTTTMNFISSFRLMADLNLSAPTGQHENRLPDIYGFISLNGEDGSLNWKIISWLTL